MMKVPAVIYNNNVCDLMGGFFLLFLLFCFHLSSSCDIGKSGMGPAPILFLGS